MQHYALLVEPMHHYQLRVNAGTVALTWNSQGQLRCVDWYDTASGEPPKVITDADLSTLPVSSRKLISRFHHYFLEGQPFEALNWNELDLGDLTEFQISVYQAITKIPHGETRTYAWVAQQIRNFDASRAVGQALRRNPFPILIPCHRVVSAHDLGGFMGASGPDDPEMRLKKFLLDLESQYLNPSFSFLAESLSFVRSSALAAGA